MAWTNSKTNGSDCATCWVHPKWAAYLRDPANIPLVVVDMTKGTQGLRGYRPPRLRARPDYTTEAHKRYLRDFNAGRVSIPGISFRFTAASGEAWEGCGGKVFNGKIRPAPKIS